MVWTLPGPDRPSAVVARGSGLPGKNVVVIGSGATAATLIPAIAADCDHVTMLQRSPTYFITGRNVNELADDFARSCRSTKRGSTRSYAGRSCTIRRPSRSRRSRAGDGEAGLIGAVRAYLGPDYDVETHFTPSYRPWRQRLAFVPDGDLFQGIRIGQGIRRHR